MHRHCAGLEVIHYVALLRPRLLYTAFCMLRQVSIAVMTPLFCGSIKLIRLHFSKLTLTCIKYVATVWLVIRWLNALFKLLSSARCDRMLITMGIAADTHR